MEPLECRELLSVWLLATSPTVSAAQAPGGYTGNIVNARTGEILGTLLIEIG